MEEIKNVLSKYTASDYEVFKDTIDMLCSKGVANGCYQDMTVLLDIMTILGVCEKIVKNGGENNE